MTRTLAQSLLVAAVLLASGWARAAAPLRLKQVLDSVQDTHPTLEGAQQKREAAEGKALSARGGFDPKVALKGKWTPVSYYENAQIDATIEQATPLWGASVYAGYRFGWGDYPAYKGDLRTREYGELRAGINVPIWNGGPIDGRRAKIATTKAGIQDADAQLDATALALEREAAQAYWSWVAAGRNLAITEGLLELARARQKALDAQVDAGAIEAIKKVDNERLVFSREAKVVKARQKLDKASIELSLYYRDAKLRPMRPSADQVPAEIRDPGPPSSVSLDAGIAEALERRPELAALDAQRDAADVEVRLAKNLRSPDASVQAFGAQDFGPGTIQPSAEFGVGFVLSIPIPLRKARGHLQVARAELAGLRAKVRGTRDKIESEVRKAHVALVASQRTWDLARKQADAASRLADAERRKFREGASDLVVVNLRELAVASAQASVVEAAADYHRAHADFRVATGRSPR
ncbi:MAG: TolC family protein [Nannocystales bacterium]